MIAPLHTDFAKLASLVGTARRLLTEGRTVDLSALEGKVREVCEEVTALAGEEAHSLVPEMELLIANLDGLALDLGAQFQGHPRSGHPTSAVAAKAYSAFGDSETGRHPPTDPESV